MKQCTLFLFLILFVGLPSSSASEKLSLIDSLERELELNHSSEMVLQITQELAWEYLFMDPDTAFDIAQEELYLAQKINDKQQKAHAYNTMGISYYFRGDYPEALIYYNKALEISNRLSDSVGISKEYNNIALIYTRMGNFPKAIEYNLMDLALIIGGDDQESIAASYNNLGNIYVRTGEYEQAADYYNRSVQISNSINDVENVARAYNNLGILMEQQEKVEEALEYYFKAMQILEKTDDKIQLSRLHNNLGGAYLAQAERLYTGTLETTVELDSLWAKSLAYFQLALATKVEMTDEEAIANIHNNLGKLYIISGDFDKSEFYLQSGLKLSQGMDLIIREQEAYEGLSSLYESTGEFEKAYFAFKEYSGLKDSLFNESKSKEIGRIEAQHEFETAESEAERIQEEEARQLAEEERRRDNLQYSIIIIIIVALAIGVIGLVRIHISTRLAEGLIFFTFLLFFEFTLVLLDPYIERYSGGAPAYKLLFNAILAAMIFPLHSLFETKLKSRLVK